MCGIAGRLSWSPKPDAGVVSEMTRRLAHRGPDGPGIYVDEEIALGHRRLATMLCVRVSSLPSNASCLIGGSSRPRPKLEWRSLT